MSVLDAESAITKLEGQLTAAIAAAVAAANAAAASSSANNLLAQQIEHLREDLREFRSEMKATQMELTALKTTVNSEEERSHGKRIGAIELQQARWIGAMLVIAAVAGVIASFFSSIALKLLGK